MPKPTEEQLYSSLQRGMQATQDLAIAIPLLNSRREQLIIQAINDFRAKPRKMDERDALLFVAALSEIGRLKDDLEYAERQGRKAGNQLQS